MEGECIILYCRRSPQTVQILQTRLLMYNDFTTLVSRRLHTCRCQIPVLCAIGAIHTQSRIDIPLGSLLSVCSVLSIP